MTDYNALGAHLTQLGQAWDAAATAAEGQLADISTEQDYLDYIDCIAAGDTVRLGEAGAAKITVADAQLDLLATLPAPTTDIAQAARSAAGELEGLQQGFDLVDTFPAVFGPGMREFLLANGVTAPAAAWAVDNIFTSSFPDKLRRQLYATPFETAKNYDSLALEAMRSAAGGRLAQLVASTKTSAATATAQNVREELTALQDHLLAALDEPIPLADIKTQTAALLQEAADLQILGAEVNTQVTVGELLREVLRTAAAVDLFGWTSTWTEPMVSAHLLEDSRTHHSLEIDCPPPPGPGQVVTPADLLDAPPTEGTIVSVTGQLSALTFKERSTHVTSWCSFSDLADSTKTVFVMAPYSMLDTSGETAGTLAVVQGQFFGADQTTGGPTVMLSRNSLTASPLARRWKRTLDSIYVPRLHGEHAWWSWDISDRLGAANPLFYGEWWR